MTALHAWQIADAVRSGEVSCVEVTRDALDRAEGRGAELGAFLHVDREGALVRAADIDLRRARGERLGRLAGVPVAVKDAICTRGLPTTAGARVLEGWVPPYDATVIARLAAEDAVVIGKTNLDAFAMGSSTENSGFFPARNPWDPARTPGGSSGGSAAAVGARVVSCALGSDTGGSIRQPAAFTGTVGLKPTYGRVSRYGLVAFASSLDQIGPFATDVRGAARVLDVISGRDPRDATSADRAPSDAEGACDAAPGRLRIGVPEEYFGEGLDLEVRASVRAAIHALATDHGATLVPVRLPHTRHAVATYYVLATAEASSNLARYDGVRYGQRRAGSTLAAMYGATRDQGFGAEVKRRILLGTYVLSRGYYDQYYRRAERVRELIRRDFERAFDLVDAVACPATPTTPFLLGEKTQDPLAMYLSDVYTLPASLAGIPAISVPCAPTAAGLPVGLQLMAPWWGERGLVALAHAWESRCPPRAPAS